MEGGWSGWSRGDRYRIITSDNTQHPLCISLSPVHLPIFSRPSIILPPRSSPPSLSPARSSGLPGSPLTDPAESDDVHSTTTGREHPVALDCTQGTSHPTDPRHSPPVPMSSSNPASYYTQPPPTYEAERPSKKSYRAADDLGGGGAQEPLLGGTSSPSPQGHPSNSWADMPEEGDDVDDFKVSGFWVQLQLNERRTGAGHARMAARLRLESLASTSTEPALSTSRSHH